MQGRFKRDGSAPAESEARGGTDRGSSPQHAQKPGLSSGGGGERSGRPGTPSAKPSPTPTVKPSSTGPAESGSRLALRNWRISTRLVSLLALPVVAATSLGALRISDSMDNIQQLDNMKLLTDMTKQATELAAALQEERDESAGPLAHGLKATDYTVKGVQEKTDRADKNFEDAAERIDAASKNGQLLGVRDSLVGLTEQLNSLSRIRHDAYQSKDNSTRTVEAYHRLITQLIDLSQDMAEASSNPEMIQRTRALAAFSSAKEYASVQRAVIAAALPANKTTTGDISENDRLYAQSALQSEDSEISIFRKIYADEGAEEILRPIDEGSPTIESADKYAQRALGSPNGLSGLPKRSYRDWIDDSSVKILEMKKIEHGLLEDMEQKARELRSSSEEEAIISGALILLVLGVSLVGAFVVARSMIRSLRRLQDTATRVAQDRLPELVKQLSESDPQDVDTSVESVGVHSRDEIGQVAAAFDDVHREAVRLAAEQALLRGNVNAMFTNLSRRSQGLIQRQLSLISELESREADPDQLSSLFKLDHLATRMRRNGENLLVLAGEEPGRRWTRPVPLVDVLRAAASEVEQYERIELAAVPTTEVAGRVVNDLVHLLAELLENATSFSSPQTKVKVTGHALPDGRVLIEIHDTGIGLSPEDLAAINERLAAPPTVDVSVSRRMGLFVVGRLSQRHGIRIQLRPSDSGGTTALVMLPVDVAQGGKKPAPGGKGGAPAVGGPAAAQAAAGAAAARRNGGQGGGAFGAAGGPSGGRLGAGASPRGQVGSGAGPRAELPGAGQGGRPGGPGSRGPQAPSVPQQGRPQQDAFGGSFGAQAPGAPQGLQAAQPGGPQQDAFGGGGRGPSPMQQRDNGADRGRQPQLPARGGARPELPGGSEQRTPSWSDGNAQPSLSRAPMDAPRGHDQDFHGQGGAQNAGQYPHPGMGGQQDTGQFPQQDTGQFPHPNSGGQQDTGSFVRSDIFGAPGGRQSGPSTGQVAAPQSYDAGSTGQFPAQGYEAPAAGRHSAPGRRDNAANANSPQHTGQFERPQAPQAPQQRQARQVPEALPSADGGDGRTPLYDTLETNWFHGQQQAGGPAQAPQAAGPESASSARQQRPSAAAWRSSPNDDLVRQAERVRQPAAGGVTTSGLPRRAPGANLVAGTAQQQPQHQTGPQVSRAPDDVRGRLTNLRRGISQGRQASSGQTGSFPSPTHQQER
ncbi:nitrate- and nitrite sensing domain-containing protein [Streptomyces sp. V3I7]|uniref:sensor histidine kinase n=1 Tax=Streptomyces sp. V3I7 TaxID=3042278 RepID=UPI00277F206B|nr:nitrate- and nitrite sensing domain-containing protein [Streptomyces sp. V3I7]MDQ0993245.1 signal transduction histidine kinase [Streptomyces sp. V3I7]